MSNNLERQIKRKSAKKVKGVISDKEMTEQLCEGLLAQVLEQTKGSLDILYNNASSLSKDTVIKSVANIFVDESVKAVEFLQPIKNQLTPKHNKCLQVLEIFNDNMKQQQQNILNIQTESDPAAIMFARLAVDFLSTLHTVLNTNTNSKDRNESLKAFKVKWKD